MIAERIELSDAQLDSPLGRTSPVVKLGVALLWLAGLAFTLSPWPPLALTVVAMAAGFTLGGISPGAVRAQHPAALARCARDRVLQSHLRHEQQRPDRHGARHDRAAADHRGGGRAGHRPRTARRSRSRRSGCVFTLTTDSTRLADSLVQQGRVSPRFAYGALAAYQAIPRFAEDLTTLRQARRIRGPARELASPAADRRLVLAIRHGDRMALSMDARAFGSGPRTWYRVVRWSWLDATVAVAAVAILWLVLALVG